MGFEVFTAELARQNCRAEKVSVSITQGKDVNFSKGAMREFGINGTQFLIVACDRDANRIAFRKPFRGEEKDAATLTKSGESAARVSIRSVLRYMGYDASETRRFVPYTDKATGMIAIDLDKPLPPSYGLAAKGATA
jgi:hypothetical protein